MRCARRATRQSWRRVRGTRGTSAGSAGSSCVACHMPRTVISLRSRMPDHTIVRAGAGKHGRARDSECLQ